MLVSSSQSKVAAGRRATTESRSATTSYLRTSRLSSEPSPIQPPAGTPVSEAILPSELPTDTFTNPASTPIQTCRSEEHTSELQSLMRISYAVFCLIKKKKKNIQHT